jgi:Protein of unknown function (DUF2462)
MAQGTGKLPAKKAAKSKGAQKHKAAKSKLVAKGRLQKKAKNLDESDKLDQEATKTINKRNERLIAAKAVSVGTKFFLNDISEKGANHVKKQTAERNKKQQKSKTSTRMEQQLQKLQK